MNTLYASPAESPPSRRIIDAPTRAIHWLLAFSFTGAYLSAESERWHLLHITLGYTVLGLVLVRLLSGVLGPKRSRLSAWSTKLRSLPQQLGAWSKGRGNLLASYQGLNTLSVVAILCFTLLAALSGLSLEQEWWGEALEDAHELLGNVALAVVLAHLALIAGVSLIRRHNHAGPMIIGRTAGAGPDLVKRNLTPQALLIVAAVAAFWWWQWQSAPSLTLLRDGPAALARDHDDDD